MHQISVLHDSYRTETAPNERYPEETQRKERTLYTTSVVTEVDDVSLYVTRGVPTLSVTHR